MTTDTIFTLGFLCGAAIGFGFGICLGFWLRGYASKWEINFWADEAEHETKRADDPNTFPLGRSGSALVRASGRPLRPSRVRDDAFASNLFPYPE